MLRRCGHGDSSDVVGGEGKRGVRTVPRPCMEGDQADRDTIVECREEREGRGC